MKTILSIIAASILISFGQDGKVKTPPENEYVSVKVSMKKLTVAGGDSAEIFFDFKPAENYYINMEPALSVKLDSNSIIASAGKVKISKGKKPEYVDTSQPVRLPVIFRKNIKKGTHEINGTLTYFYCSAQDGWCSKYKQLFSTKITVK